MKFIYLFFIFITFSGCLKTVKEKSDMAILPITETINEGRKENLSQVTHLPQVTIDDFIEENHFRKLGGDEEFLLSDRISPEDGEGFYLYTVSITKDGHAEMAMKLKSVFELILYNDKKKFILHGQERPVNGNGDPLFLLDGINGKIEYLDNLWPGFFLVDDYNILINRLLYTKDPNRVDDLYIYDIEAKKMTFIYDVNAYLIAKLGTDMDDGYELDFPDFAWGKTKIYDGRIKLYFNQWGNNGPKSFHTFLNIQDKYNIYIE